MIYCLSDLHGEDERYQAFVKDLLRDEDTAYVLGDVIDRHRGGCRILLDIMKRPNVHLILGNHEYMMRQALSEGMSYWDLVKWRGNGGDVTETEFRKLDTKEQKKIIDFLRNCPDHVELSVNGQQFHLVHAWPGDNTYDRVWSRNKWKSPLLGKTVIIGHTPTAWISNNLQDAMEDGKLCIYPKREMRENLSLGYIGIDCGCGHPLPCRMAVLRLDDMTEFYY